MPIVHVTQAVLCQLGPGPEPLYRLTIFGKEEVLDNFDTPTPIWIINKLKEGKLVASHDQTILYQLSPLEKQR